MSEAELVKTDKRSTVKVMRSYPREQRPMLPGSFAVRSKKRTFTTPNGRSCIA
jgi:hypothetical protein